MENNNQITQYKEIMSQYPTGVTIMTTMNNQTPSGLTVNSFASVSIDPLLVLWSIDKKASTFQDFINTGKFAVHILGEDQGELASRFAKRGVDRFENTNWELSSLGLPILSGTAATLECETYQAVEAGDHIIFIGKVLGLKKNDVKPMLYFGRKFGKVQGDW